MTGLIAVDPGDVHCGVAFFIRADNEWGWQCTNTEEFEPDEFLDALAETYVDQDPAWQFLVYEKFRLYADKARLQTGSEFPTAQAIGVIRWLGRTHNRHAAEHRAALESGSLATCQFTGGTCDPSRNGGRGRYVGPVELVCQPADIKKPTAGILRTRGIKSVAKREGDTLGHRVDAELHGWYFLLRTLAKREASK